MEAASLQKLTWEFIPGLANIKITPATVSSQANQWRLVDELYKEALKNLAPF